MPPMPAPKNTYTVPPHSTKLAHNAKSQEALGLLEDNPEISEWLRNNHLADIRNQIEQLLNDAGWEMSEKLMQFGVQLCPNVASVWLSNHLESSLRALTEFFAGTAISQGDSKATLSKAIGIAPQSFNVRLPQASEIAEAQNRADETGTPEDILLHGDPFTIYPMREHQSSEAEE